MEKMYGENAETIVEDATDQGNQDELLSSLAATMGGSSQPEDSGHKDDQDNLGQQDGDVTANDTKAPPEEDGEVKTPGEDKDPAAGKPEDRGKPDNWAYAAYKAEQEKRQALEARLDALEKQGQQSAQEPQKTEFDWQNPENSLNAIEQRMDQKVQAVKLTLSEEQAMRNHEDYGEKYKVFNQMLHDNPAILQTVVNAADPAEKLYQMASQKMLTDEVGADPAAYREKIAAEERAKIEKEIADKAAAKLEQASKLPPSSTDFEDRVPVKKKPASTMGQLFPGQTVS